MPAQFEYEVAGSVDEAISLLQRRGPESPPSGRGHSLIPMMKLRLAFPEVLMDIHKLDDELRYVREEDGGEPRGLHGDKVVWKLVEGFPERVRYVEIDADLPPDVDTPEDFELALTRWRDAT